MLENYIKREGLILFLKKLNVRRLKKGRDLISDSYDNHNMFHGRMKDFNFVTSF